MPARATAPGVDSISRAEAGSGTLPTGALWPLVSCSVFRAIITPWYALTL